MRLVSAVVVILLSLSCRLVPGLPDDGDASLFRDKEVNFLAKELELFRNTGICRAEVTSTIGTCDIGESQPILNWIDLKRSSCYCDNLCSEYQDCCIDKVGFYNVKSLNWSCREVRGINVSRIPIYVYQKCPRNWNDEFTKGMCETEALERERLKMTFNHLQDLPVQSETTNIFYRNIYCAVCNGDTRLVKWETYLYCNGDSERSGDSFLDDPDFSNAVYVPRTMNFRRVKVNGRLRNCQINVKRFDLPNLVTNYGARLCKPVINTCPVGTDSDIKSKCNAYTSYIYRVPKPGREIYKNFHCALCNGVPIENLSCLDSYIGPVYGTPWGPTGRAPLTMLFDFNYQGGLEEIGNQSPCLLHEGQIWDPIFRKCQNFTCGTLYKREGSRCVPISISDENGLKNSCPKVILNSDDFHVLTDRSVYINRTMKYLAKDEYEVYRKENSVVLQIAICVDDTHLLPYSLVHSWLSAIVLSVSIICLILHLVVYGMLEKLRNRPGKILMSLAISLLCGHLFLLLGPYFRDIFWLCYFNGVLIHFGYFAAFSWMSVMAYDIHGTFSVTQTNNSNKSKIFLKYSLFAWLCTVCLVLLSIIIDNSLPKGNSFRPRYAEPTCWLNSKKGLLIFFVSPATILLIANIVLFGITAFHFRKVSRQTKMVNNFSDKVRYFLYLKLAVVLGLTWILGLVAGITRMDVFWYPFIILNGLQGALIFIAFTIKKNILNMLAIKLKIRSDKYRMGKSSGIKAAMYSSLSNLTTLQTTTSSQIPSLTNDKEMLKAVRKINPDTVLDEKRRVNAVPKG
ncbi:probable G-protein coupled receptor Mth-like 3 [Nephila pilipes]|uniref:Probable G-protein coupled receptor Mth-like 3 n=1 Tax=Nephila pilipes TaxID=299642 RepID=A0A8X6U9Q7_NEPPI|nr:probable G-protein coupled receptor Mth-like 3 [Nephila pilipes]